MLLQGACAARLGRNLFERPFIVMALYIEKCGRVQRYFLFQSDGPDSKKVCTFQSKQYCIFSVALIGFLCRGLPKLEATAITF